MNILFICNQGLHRSRTAAELFSRHFATAYAGIYANPVTNEQMRWADLVVVMEEGQRRALAEEFPSEFLKKRIITMDIPDIYRYRQPELIEELRAKASLIEPALEL
jgi:predicted protein tyrosine phosphatase